MTSIVEAPMSTTFSVKIINVNVLRIDWQQSTVTVDISKDNNPAAYEQN